MGGVDYEKKTAATVEYGKGTDAFVDHGEAAVAMKYLGTDADVQDMLALGRKQVLRVSHACLTRCVGPESLFSVEAKLQSCFYDRVLCGPHRDLGTTFRVSSAKVIKQSS